MRAGKWTMLAAVAAVAVTAMAVASAGASRIVNHRSTVTINAYVTGGKVKSPSHACEVGRRVTVRQKGHGTLGHAKTNDKGVWSSPSILGNVKGSIPYRIYAVVSQRTEGTAGTIQRCLAAKSNTKVISGG
jgi:hypothetical protein